VPVLVITRFSPASSSFQLEQLFDKKKRKRISRQDQEEREKERERERERERGGRGVRK
jgi:hypothetical protein